MSSSPRRLLGLVVACASFAAACAPTIMFEDEDGTSTNGTPGAPSGGSSGNPQGGPGGETGNPPPEQCTETCEDPSDGLTCSCVSDCSQDHSIECQWIVTAQGETKLMCVCTIKDTFSGACYEKHEDKACDFEEGCCAKYFSGK